MRSVAPSMTTLEAPIPLARASAVCETPYRVAISDSVSPTTTRWERPPPLLADPPAPGTLSVLPAKIRLPLPGSRLTCTSRATVVSYLAAMSLSVSPLADGVEAPAGRAGGDQAGHQQRRADHLASRASRRPREVRRGAGGAVGRSDGRSDGRGGRVIAGRSFCVGVGGTSWVGADARLLILP